MLLVFFSGHKSQASFLGWQEEICVYVCNICAISGWHAHPVSCSNACVLPVCYLLASRVHFVSVSLSCFCCLIFYVACPSASTVLIVRFIYHSTQWRKLTERGKQTPLECVRCAVLFYLVTQWSTEMSDHIRCLSLPCFDLWHLHSMLMFAYFCFCESTNKLELCESH